MVALVAEAKPAVLWPRAPRLAGRLQTGGDRRVIVGLAACHLHRQPPEGGGSFPHTHKCGRGEGWRWQGGRAVRGGGAVGRWPLASLNGLVSSCEGLRTHTRGGWHSAVQSQAFRSALLRAQECACACPHVRRKEQSAPP